MMRFLKLFDGIDVLPAVMQLQDNPQLWNEHPERTAAPDSPHYGVPDVWLRYRDQNELAAADYRNEPHFPVWYPAWGLLPALRPIVFAIMARCEATHLGGILLTRISPGGRVQPHDDRGGWHAEFHRCKVYVPLMGNDRCINRCADETVCMVPGTAWMFDNLVEHEVRNDGTTPRVTLIVSMRREV